jgi:nicotinate-nucleotide adenylyltransferase
VTSSKSPLLVYGGSFDPIHNGHLAAFWQAAAALGAVEARLLPCFISPLKERVFSTPAQRCQLLQLVVDALNTRSSGTQFSLDLRELAVAEPSFTWRTLAALRAEEGAFRPIIWLMGMDAWQHLTQWQHWQQLTDYAHLLIALRPGPKPSLSAEQLAWAAPRIRTTTELSQSPAGGISQMNNAELAIAASDIRQQITQGLRPVGLLPEAVEQWIFQHNLYVNPPQTDTL